MLSFLQPFRSHTEALDQRFGIANVHAPERYSTVYVRDQGRMINAERKYDVVHEDSARLERLEQDIRADMSYTDRRVVANAITLVNAHNDRPITTPEQLTAAARRHSPLHVTYRVQEGRPAPKKRALPAQPPLEITSTYEPVTPTLTPEQSQKQIAAALKETVCAKLAADVAALPSVKKGFPLELGSPIYDKIHASARSIMAEQHDSLRRMGALDPAHLAHQMSIDLAHSACKTDHKMLARTPESALRAELGRSAVWRMADERIAGDRDARRPRSSAVVREDSDWSSCDDAPAWSTSRAAKLNLNINLFVSGKDAVPQLAGVPAKAVGVEMDPLSKTGFVPYRASDYRVHVDEKPIGSEWRFEPAEERRRSMADSVAPEEFEPVGDETNVYKPAKEEWEYMPFDDDFQPVGEDQTATKEAWTFVPFSLKEEAFEPVLPDKQTSRNLTRRLMPSAEDFEPVMPDKETVGKMRNRDYRLKKEAFEPVMLSDATMEKVKANLRFKKSAFEPFMMGQEMVGADEEEFDVIGETAAPQPVGKWMWWRKKTPKYMGTEPPARLVVYNRQAQGGLEVWVMDDTTGQKVAAAEGADVIPYRGKGEVWLRPGKRHLYYRESGQDKNIWDAEVMIHANTRYSVVIGMPFNARPRHMQVPWMSTGNKPAQAVVRAEMPQGYSASLVDPATNEETTLGAGIYAPVSPGVKKMRVNWNGKTADMPQRVMVMPGRASMLLGAEEGGAGKLHWKLHHEADAADDLYDQHAELRDTAVGPGMMFIDRNSGQVTVGAEPGNFHAADQKECELRDKDGQAFIFDANRTWRFDDALDSKPVAVHAVFEHPHQPRMTVVVMGAPSQ